MFLPEYDLWDAHDISEAIDSGLVSSREVLEAAAVRIETRNPGLNAVVYQALDAARASLHSLPAGPFRGVPVLLKDLVADWEGHPLTSGSKLMRSHISTQDSHLVRRLKSAGMVLMGRTNTPELGILGVTEPALYGPTRNPWHREHTSGGSSGGAGSAVAARMVPIAHGGDGGGSLRIPASACGVLGLKPTRGRVSLAPTRGEAWSGFVQEFVLTRSVRDCAAMLDWLSLVPPGEPYVAPASIRPFVQELGVSPGFLRIGFTAGPLLGSGEAHADCIAALEHATSLLVELGHHVEEAAPRFDRDALLHAYMVVVAANVAATLAELERQVGRSASWSELEPSTWFMRRLGEALTAAELVQAQTVIEREARAVASFFSRWDLLLTPTLSQPPVRVGELALRPLEVAGIRMISAAPIKSALLATLHALAQDSVAATPNTQLFNQTGQPAMSVPLYWNAQGLPIGIQLVAGFGDEALLMRIASQLEAAAPWAARLPPGL